MNNKILGLHHITAIAGDAQRNYNFYTKVLGLRLVKKTVNFDDPGTYHFYYGDEAGTPGSILTFFPWAGIQKGCTGTGMATEIGYSVPEGSIDFWTKRFDELRVKHTGPGERFGEQYISLEDPDGLLLNLIVPASADNRKPWTTNEVKEDMATKGFHSAALAVKRMEPTAKILTDIFNYKLLKQEGNRYRFVTNALANANIVDIVEVPNGEQGYNGSGTNHHVAFRAKDDNLMMEYQEKVRSAGFSITGKIDRNYFYSLYFREPGGILFEIASDNPGFAVDEAKEHLGEALKLPSEYEVYRKKIEEVLPKLHQ
jgi:glyoxalase family protein